MFGGGGGFGGFGGGGGGQRTTFTFGGDGGNPFGDLFGGGGGGFQFGGGGGGFGQQRQGRQQGKGQAKNQAPPGMYGAADNITMFTSRNINGLRKDAEVVWLVEFYHPDCADCRSFSPTFKKLAQALRGMIFAVVFFKFRYC